MQKRMGNRTSNYLIAMDPKPTDRKSENIVGKLRANWVRTAFRPPTRGHWLYCGT